MSSKGPFGRYRIEGLLGEGAMARVYKAYDARHDRYVALKILKEAWRGDREVLDRFFREARAAGALNHPNIVIIYNVDAEPEPFIDMELVEGPSLARLLKERGGLPAGQAMAIAKALASALDYAHSHDRVHRDIKPSNVLLATDLVTPKLTDFGIAVIDRPEVAELTQHGQMLGTPRYMSPEQIRGERADARSDLFSLGATLYEMLTGRYAFPGETLVALTSQITQDQPVPVRRLAPDVPSPVAAAVEKLLQKDPARRFQSGRELVAALEAASVGSARSQRQKEQRRVPIVATLAALGVLALGGGLAALYFWPLPENRPPAAGNDRAVTRAGEPVTIEVMANDVDPDGDALRIVSADILNEGPGRLAIVGDRLRYEPAGAGAALREGESAQVIVAYRVSDVHDASAEGRVEIEVVGTGAPLPANQPPVAREDRATTFAGEPVRIDVLANDVDPDGDPLVIAGADASGDVPGTIRIESDHLVYDAGAAFQDLTEGQSRLVELTYRVRDPSGAEAEAPVRIEVWGKGELDGDPLLMLVHEAARSPCSRIEVESGTDGSRLIGYVGAAADRAALVERARTLLGDVAIRVAAPVGPLPMCPFLNFLDDRTLPHVPRLLRLVPPLDGACEDGAVGCYLGLADYRLAEGERLVLEIATPDFASYGTVDYFMADGQVAHLEPAPDLTRGMVPAEAYRRARPAGITFFIGDGRAERRIAYPIGSPFGREMILILAARRPLFAEGRPAVEPAEIYLAALERALDAQSDQRPLASVLILETVGTSP